MDIFVACVTPDQPGNMSSAN